MRRVVCLVLVCSGLLLVPGALVAKPGREYPLSIPIADSALGGPGIETGFIPPEQSLAHLDGSSVPRAMARQALPDSWDWRAVGGGAVTPIKNQGACGSCYAFAAVADGESRILLGDGVTHDFSENNAKECNYRELAGISGWGSCTGGNYRMLVTLLSTKGAVLESYDPYQATDVACNTCVPYEKTLRDWRMVSGYSIPDSEVLKQYVHAYGPIATSVYVDDSEGFDWQYDGQCTLSYPPTGVTNHAVVIVGWGDNLPTLCDGGTGDSASGWIVRNSWGAWWGDEGYFYMSYGAGDLGRYSAFSHTWADYDPSDHVLHYDEDGWTISFGNGTTTAWGLVALTAQADTVATSVELWTTDAPATTDVYLYDEFDGQTLSGPIAAELDLTFPEAGYHSVPLNPPALLLEQDTVYVAVRFGNATYRWPVAADYIGPTESGRTWIGTDEGAWQDPAQDPDYPSDVAIRLRTTHPNGGAYVLRGEQCGTSGTACPLYDDGTHGDTFAGDRIHTRDHTVNDPLAPNQDYHFHRLDGAKRMPSSGVLQFSATGSCPVYLLAQGNPYGVTVTDCDSYAHVTCDDDGSAFEPVSAIGGGDFVAASEKRIELGTTLDVRVQVLAAGLTDAGAATQGDAVSVRMETRQWNGALQNWGQWTSDDREFAFELDAGSSWQYVLTGVALPVGIHELRATYRDWSGATGNSGTQTLTVFVSDPTTTPHTIAVDGDAGDWRRNERHSGLDGAEGYVTWDSRYLYIGWAGGAAGDRCIAGIDLDTGSENVVAPYAGGYFPASGQPDHILDYDTESGLLAFRVRNGSGWEDLDVGEVSVARGGGGVVCEARIPRSAFGTDLELSDDLGIVLFRGDPAGTAVSGAIPATGNGSGTSPQPLNAQFHWSSAGAGIAPNFPPDGGRSEYATSPVPGAVAGTYILGTTGVTIGFASDTEAPDSACEVAARVFEGHQHPAGPAAARRYYTLEGDDCSGFSADLGLGYADDELNGNEETSLLVHRWTGSDWESFAVAAGDRDPQANTVLTQGVTGFSDWVLGDGGPTSVRLVSFEAECLGGEVALAWQTAFGAPVLGYNVLRAETEDGPLTKLNNALIVSATPGEVFGGSYGWTDGTVVGGRGYWYHLAEVAFDGTETLYGPVHLIVPAGTAYLPLLVR